MAGAFQDLLGVADDTVDEIYAESFAFVPMSEVKNGKPVVDISRDAIEEVTAVFDDEARLVAAPGAFGGGAPPHASSGPMISVLASYLPQGVKRFDRFTRTDGGKVYEVKHVSPDGLGRMLLTVAEVRA